MFVITGLNLFLAGMVTVGLPYMVKIFLGLTSQHQGFAEGAMGVGAIVGGLLAGVFAKKVPFNRSYRFLLTAVLLVLPAAASVVSNAHPLVSYGVLLASVLGCMAGATLFNISAQTFIQQQTPDHLIGKVMSFVSVIAVCTLPVGQACTAFCSRSLRIASSLWCCSPPLWGWSSLWPCGISCAGCRCRRKRAEHSRPAYHTG